MDTPKMEVKRNEKSTPKERLRESFRKKVLSKKTDYSDLQERIEYNSSITVLPESMKNITIVGERGLVVALFKFTKATTEDGGIYNPKYLAQTSEGGKPTFDLDDFVHQARGVVVAISKEAEKYIEEKMETPIKVGSIVWVGLQAMNNTYQFIHNREVPVVQAKYLKIHPNVIEAVENTDLLNITYQTNKDGEDSSKEG